MEIASKLALSFLILSVALPVAQAADYIWIEGESASSHNMQRHNWYDSVTKDSLSGGEWLSHYAEGTPPEAEFNFDVPEDGEYFFWIRANSVSRPELSYKLGGGSWVQVNLSNAIENLNIATDGKPDMRFISWNNAGKINTTCPFFRYVTGHCEERNRLHFWVSSINFSNLY